VTAVSGAVSAEWLKIRSVWSTYVVLLVPLAAVAFALVLDLYATVVWDHLLPISRPGYTTMMTQAITVPLTEIAAGVFGVLAITSEYATGQIRASLIVSPRRGLLLAAKSPVVGVVALVFGLAAVGTASLVGRAIIGDRVAARPELGRELVLLAASGAAVMVFALLGLALGVLLRSTAGAIVVVAVVWYPLPMIAQWLPAPWNVRMTSVVPMNLPAEISGYHVPGPPPGLLSAPVAACVLAAYAVVPLAAAYAVFMRRDIR
jgi:ABC-type transport system involved in multi-copper enzyme maturation permease subunit